ncbi:phosphoglucan phosphatase LSF2, chloroplastic [Lolium perenne]|uniref:phosphoglucan phosphatase LSF2, chloroplastic n=1 Tax=Lolium perenne TaxID=4522 RepID=UPI0021EB0F9E|nr:phosphoglucan phosphatase LSF2, chloroplastic [Lolium perenne]
MAATANASCLPASQRLPASGAGVRTRARPAMAAVGCAPGRGGVRRRSVFPLMCRSSSAAAETGGSGRMEDYNTAMKRMMRNPYEYHHDLGMNYAVISDSLIVGSQPQKPEDIDHLKDEENVAYILCLQQDKDIDYWGIDFQAVVTRCRELGIQHMRRPAVDFDPDSLRKQLPKAVSALEWAISQGKGRVYIHCTAGLGRAPAVAISYMFWFENMDLNTAYNKLTSIRPCGPSKKAIRSATYDLAKSDPNKEAFETLPEHAFEGVSVSERKLIQDRVRALYKA